MDKPRRNRTFSERFLSLLGIKYEAEENPSTSIMTSEQIKSGTGLVLPKTLKSRYQVQRSLGFGGYGTVFLARDIIIGRLVALKVLNTELIPFV